MAALSSSYLPQFDRAYLNALKARDAEVESHFAGYFGRVLQRRVRARFSKEPADDVIQETLVRVLSAVRSRRVRRPRAFAGFMGKVCDHVALESYRQRDRFQDLESLLYEPIDGARSPEALASARQIGVRVHRIIGLLPAADRRLLSAVFFEGKTRQDICAELGIKRSALRVRLHRAKRQFRQLWEASMNPPREPRASAG